LKKHIPNLLTCGNLLCGCIGIVATFQDNLVLAAYLTGIAGVLDFFDGFVARWLKAYSAIGKDLDSLADCVTFGVLPGMILFHLMRKSIPPDIVTNIYNWLPFVAFIISIFSALRLAKFNVDTRQTTSFIGVPTPANAFLISSLPLILWQYPPSEEIILNMYFLIGIILIMSYLMISEIPLFALKFTTYAFSRNRPKYIFLFLSLVLIFTLQFIAIPFIIALYILISVFNRKSVS
jgi:CDP-diacylglycerol--serine O-phosphatidyltransferase